MANYFNQLLLVVVVPRLFIRCLVAYSVFFDTEDVSVLVLKFILGALTRRTLTF